MKRKLEHITQDYWVVSNALRNPDNPGMKCGLALTTINSADTLRPEEWRLIELVHVLRYDIIEGNTKWRDSQKVTHSASILPMKG